MIHLLSIPLFLIILLPNSLSVESSDFQEEMLRAVNEIREKGCICGGKEMPPASPLVWNRNLETAAYLHAEDMESKHFIAHKGSNGSKISERVEKSGYKWAAVGENISWGAKNIPSAMRGWINSPGHCKSLMNPSFKEMGAAQSGSFMVQVFGRKRNW